MRTVDYDHILQIMRRCAEQDKSAKEVYQLVVFAFGE